MRKPHLILKSLFKILIAAACLIASVAAYRFLLHPLIESAFSLGEHDPIRPQLRVQAGDAVEVDVQHLGCSDGAVGQHAGLLRGSCESKLTIIHVDS